MGRGAGVYYFYVSAHHAPPPSPPPPSSFLPNPPTSSLPCDLSLRRPIVDAETVGGGGTEEKGRGGRGGEVQTFRMRIDVAESWVFFWKERGRDWSGRRPWWWFILPDEHPLPPPGGWPSAIYLDTQIHTPRPSTEAGGGGESRPPQPIRNTSRSTNQPAIHSPALPPRTGVVAETGKSSRTPHSAPTWGAGRCGAGSPVEKNICRRTRAYIHVNMHTGLWYIFPQTA